MPAKLFTCTGRSYSKHWGYRCTFWGKSYGKKARPKQMPILTTSNEIFFKNRGTRSGTTIAPYEGLE